MGNYRLSNPHERRWMLFVDGENFTIRAQEVMKTKGIVLSEGKYYQRDVFAWFEGASAREWFVGFPPHPLQATAIRAHYYTSVQGDEPKLTSVRQSLWELGFHPEVFKRDASTRRSKGVDIALAKDFLCNAFLDNYDVAVLFAGDGDYIPIVNEVKRMGKVVYVCAFYESGLNQALRLTSDECFSIDDVFAKFWTPVTPLEYDPDPS